MLVDDTTDEYLSATRPHNSATTQRPARVAALRTPADISTSLAEFDALERSAGRKLEVVVQATGHGAGAVVDEHVVLLDTSRPGRRRSSRPCEPSRRHRIRQSSWWRSATSPARRDGAVVSPPGAFGYHAVGSLVSADRARIDARLQQLTDTWAPADTGVAPGAWDRSTSPPLTRPASDASRL